MSQSNAPMPSESTQPYLAALDRELHGRVPVEVRQAYLGETEFWLDRQVTDFFMQGSDLEAATEKAMARHGKVRDVARTLVEQWYESEVTSPLLRRVGRANAVAGTLFGLGNLLILVCVQVAVFLPSDRVLLPLSPAVVRSVIPENLPLPELSWQFLVLLFGALATPIVMGILTGLSIPVGAHRAVYRVMCPILLSVFLVGCALLPNTSGLCLALFETIFWLPVGCLAAYLSSLFARNRAIKKEGKTAGTRPPGSVSLGAT